VPGAFRPGGPRKGRPLRVRVRRSSPYRPGWLMLGALVVALVIGTLQLVAPLIGTPPQKHIRQVSLVIVPPEEEEREEAEPEDEDWEGQIVEVSPPELDPTE